MFTPPIVADETERLQNQQLRTAAIHSPSNGSVSFSAVGEPSFSAISSTSSSLGACGSSSSPGARLSAGIPGPVPAIVSLIGSSFGPVLIFSLSSAIAASFASPDTASSAPPMFLAFVAPVHGSAHIPGMTRFLPILPLRDIVVFPHRIVPLFVGREKSVAALEAAMAADKELFLVAQLDPGEDDPDRDAMYDLGVIATAMQLLKLPDGTVRVLV